MDKERVIAAGIGVVLLIGAAALSMWLRIGILSSDLPLWLKMVLLK